jgi:hypothetical protein
MSYARLNIWLRYADCSLITDCWRTDLVIKTCGGEPLVNMDPTVLERLRAQYDDYKYVEKHDYMGETRIMLSPDGTRRGRSIYHIEVDVPPGCYIVWTRICYRRNEETNKVMVIVGCGDHACVNLLLDAVETCSNELFHPFLEHAVGLRLPKRELQIVAKAFMAVMEKPKKEVIRELDQRLQDVEGMKDPGLQKAISAVMEIVKAMPAEKEPRENKKQ